MLLRAYDPAQMRGKWNTYADKAKPKKLESQRAESGRGSPKCYLQDGSFDV